MKYPAAIIAIVIFIIAILPQFALAANPCTATGNARADLGKCVNQIYLWSMAVAALAALLMMVLGGYLYMTAGGNAEQTGKGGSFIMSAIVGLCLLFGAYLLLRTINPDLTKLEINTEFQPTPPGARGGNP